MKTLELGFGAHSKLPGKKLKLKNIPKPFDGKKYTEETEKLNSLRDTNINNKRFLNYLMNICPTKIHARSTKDNFGKTRIVLTKKNLYESFTSFARFPIGSTEYKTFSRYLDELFERRSEFIPSVDQPKYVRPSDIPNPTVDNTRYYQFFTELRSSVINTLDNIYSHIKEEKIH